MAVDVGAAKIKSCSICLEESSFERTSISDDSIGLLKLLIVKIVCTLLEVSIIHNKILLHKL